MAPAKGGKGKAKAPANPIAQQAHLQVKASEQPILHQIAAERAANLAKAQQQMGFSKAAASIMQAAAPQISDLYSGAANADAGYAKGLGDVAQQPVDQSVASNNAFLTKMGTPTGGLETAAPIGTINYGLHGYIPATTLQREGAAFGAAAQLAPGNQLAQGQQLAGATLTNDPNLAPLQTELGKIAATEPSVYQGLLTQAENNAYKQQQLSIDRFRANTSAYQGQERIDVSRQGLALRAQQYAQSNKQAWVRIGIAKGNLRLRASQAEAKLQAGLASGGTSGYTADKIAEFKKEAAPMATALFNGSHDKTGKLVAPPEKYNFAMKYLITRGIPPSIADNELRAAGYHQGDGRGTPKESPFLTMGGVGGPVPFGATNKVSGIKDPIERKAAGIILDQAQEYLGTPYVWGGESPKGFDCSGFAQYLYGKAGISIPRTTYTQWQTGSAVPPGQLQPGDLVFFKGSDSIGGLPGHVGIYIGGGKMIDAPHTGSTVRVDNVASFGGYMGARRYR